MILWSGSNTPRAIKAGSGVLQTALSGYATREERDLATSNTFLSANSAFLGIESPATEFAVERFETDDLGRSHVRYQQEYQGLEVWPAGLIVHLDGNGNVDKMSGEFVPTPNNLSLSPGISADEAARTAEAAVADDQGTTATASEPRLVIYALSGTPTLAFWVQVRLSPTACWMVFVDAETGEVLKAVSLIRTEAATGSGTDVWGNNQLDTQIN